jgi:hypothetical protein
MKYWIWQSDTCMCGRKAGYARIYFRVLEHALCVPACFEHRTELELKA